MPWINNNSYNPGQRHYVEGVVRTFTSEPLSRPQVQDDEYRYQKFVDKATSPTLCSLKHARTGRFVPRPWEVNGYICTNAATGKVQHKSGGISVKETINLMQRNICGTCIKEYFNTVRPDLRDSYMALKNGRLEVSG